MRMRLPSMSCSRLAASRLRSRRWCTSPAALPSAPSARPASMSWAAPRLPSCHSFHSHSSVMPPPSARSHGPSQSSRRARCRGRACCWRRCASARIVCRYAPARSLGPVGGQRSRALVAQTSTSDHAENDDHGCRNDNRFFDIDAFTEQPYQFFRRFHWSSPCLGLSLASPRAGCVVPSSQSEAPVRALRRSCRSSGALASSA